MRIAFVIGTLDIGGTETQMCRLARELTAEGHEVEVLVLAGRGPLAEVLEAAGIAWRGFGYLGLRFRDDLGRFRPWVVLSEFRKFFEEFRKFFEMWREFRRFKPDVCHAFLFAAYVIALPCAALARVPVRVGGRRGVSRPYAGSLILRALERLSDRCAHAIAANSRAVAQDVIVHEGVAPAKICVIHNGVDVPPATVPVEHQPATGLIVANLIYYKGHADLVSALALLEDPPTIRAVGEGPERPALEAKIAECGLDGVLRLEGTVPDASRLYLEVQFGLLASHEEGFPNAILEAMAAGVPVVATAVGGVPEMVEHEVTGLLVPPRRPAALAEAIARIASDPRLRVRLGREARERARRDFSWERCRESHLALYRELLGG